MGLSQEQFRSIMREYDERRNSLYTDLEKRRDLLYINYPEIEKTNQALSQNGIARIKASLTKDKKSLEILEQEKQEIVERKRYLYQYYRIPDDYLEPKFTCPYCKDTGYIDNQKCSCLVQRISDLLYDQSGIKELLNRENFSVMKSEYYDQDEKIGSRTLSDYMKNQIDYCREYVRDFDAKHESILFYGPPGTSKTFLTNCIAKELLDSCHSVLYFSAIRLFDLFSRNRFDSDGGDFSDSVLNCDLLVIDDLGTESTNTFSRERLFFCVNERLIASKATIISSNLDRTDIKQTYGERIFSRIASGYHLIRTTGKDIRIMKKYLLKEQTAEK